MKVIITGKMSVGKTTVAKYLQASHGFYCLALADAIKFIEADLDTKSDADIYAEHIGRYVGYDPMDQAIIYKIFNAARNIPRETPKPRKRLQFIGTEGIRTQVDPLVWVKIADARIKELEAAGYTNIVIDDVRFLNEYNYFVNRGWFPIKLQLASDVQLDRLVSLYPDFDVATLEHASEKDQETIFDLPGGILINTDQSIEETQAQVEQLFVQGIIK